MNKIRNFISTVNRQALAGVFCLLAGICFIALSGVFLHVIIRIAGGALALVSLVRFAYAIKKYSGTVMKVAVINSSVLVLLGLVMLVSPGGILGLVYVAIGAYLAVNAFAHIYKLAIAPKRVRSPSRWSEILISSLILALGLWLIFAAGAVQRLTEIIAGISLILKSAELFRKAFNERARHENEKKRDIEADFVDKSNEL